jgi:hypothetical protein
LSGTAGLNPVPFPTQQRIAARYVQRSPHLRNMRARVRALGLAVDQSELFYTDGGKRPAQSHKCRAPSRAPKPLGVRAFEGLGCAPHGRGLSLNSRPRPHALTDAAPILIDSRTDGTPASAEPAASLQRSRATLAVFRTSLRPEIDAAHKILQKRAKPTSGLP